MSDRIAEIRERLEKATPGPWDVYASGSSRAYRPGISADRGVVTPEVWDTTEHENAEFIAHAPDDIAFLLAHLSAVTDALDREKLADLLNSSQHAPMETHHGGTGECLQCPWPLHELGPVEIADAVRRHVFGKEEQ